MKRPTAILLSLILCLAVLAGCASDGGNTSQQPAGEESAGQPEGTDEGGEDTQDSGDDGLLNLFTWEGMFPQEVLSGFESETGIRINYVNFDYDETMLTRLQNAGGGEYDLIIADDYIIETVIEEGLAQKLDTSRLSGYGNINPVYQGQFFDPADEYTVPYGAGVQTIVYNPAAVDREITGYEDLWDESLRDNLGIISNFRVVNGMALKVLGESYNTEDLDKIQEAGDLLLELAPNIRLIKDDNLQDDLVTGEVGAAVMYTSQVYLAKLANPDLQVVYPTEGIGFGIMAGFIPSQAPHADAAYQFLDYLLRPEIAAQCFEWVGYYTTNLASEEHIDPDLQDFLTLPDGFGGDLEMIGNIGGDAQDLHAKIWTEFRAASGN